MHVSLEFDYGDGETNPTADPSQYRVRGLSIDALLCWIGRLHGELTDQGVLPDGISDQTHNELMALATEADRAANR